MPLPPALAARLSKRGLIKSDEPKHVHKGAVALLSCVSFQTRPLRSHTSTLVDTKINGFRTWLFLVV